VRGVEGHLGSSSLTTSNTGALVAQLRYLPYGGTRWESGTTPTDFRFTGQRHESGFGLYDYHARYYDPLLGRFVSADSIVPSAGKPQALNRYSYVLNSPLKYQDPTGHDPWSVIADFAYGFLAQWRLNQGLLTPQQVAALSVKRDESDASVVGRHVGNVASVAQGVAEMVGGVGLATGGGLGGAASCPVTVGAGCVVGAEAVIAGSALTAHGATVGALGLGQEVSMLGEAANQLLMAKGSGGSEKIPGNPFRGKHAPEEAFKHLEKNHGLDPTIASNRLHKLKELFNLAPDDNVVIGRTGDVYDERTGNYLGSLTDPTWGKER
jgi:RHS repeat-associated protein